MEATECMGQGADEAEQVAHVLKLESHPEGGKFKEVYKSDKEVQITNQNIHYPGPRKAGTGIYYMLRGEQFVSWHRHKSDVLFFWHKGAAVRVHELSPDGQYSCRLLGDPSMNPEAQFQVSVRPFSCYAKEVLDKSSYSLYSCVVIPGFEYEDWHEASRQELMTQFPSHGDVIAKFTRH